MYHGIQIELRFTWDNQQVENVFHARPIDPGSSLDSSTADSIFAVVDNWVKTTLQPHQQNGVFYREVEIKDTAPGGHAFLYAGDGSHGDQGGAALPNQVTIAIKKSTGFAGRKFRGRFYHVGLALPDVDGNNLTPAAATALVSIYSALMTSLAANGTPLALPIWDRSVTPPQVNGDNPVISITLADTTIDSQRRRLPGRGN